MDNKKFIRLSSRLCAHVYQKYLLPFHATKFGMKNALLCRWKKDPAKVLKSRKRIAVFKNAFTKFPTKFDGSFLGPQSRPQYVQPALLNLLKAEGVQYDPQSGELTDTSVSARNQAIQNLTLYTNREQRIFIVGMINN
jgi:hypothetical protein